MSFGTLALRKLQPNWWWSMELLVSSLLSPFFSLLSPLFSPLHAQHSCRGKALDKLALQMAVYISHHVTRCSLCFVHACMHHHYFRFSLLSSNPWHVASLRVTQALYKNLIATTHLYLILICSFQPLLAMERKSFFGLVLLLFIVLASRMWFVKTLSCSSLNLLCTPLLAFFH